MKNINIELENKDFELFMLYQLLGILTAVKKGSVSTDVGIWTIGRPDFIEFLERNTILSNPILGIMKTCDELSAIRELLGHVELNKVISGFIFQIEQELKKIADCNYIVHLKE